MSQKTTTKTTSTPQSIGGTIYNPEIKGDVPRMRTPPPPPSPKKG